jgi:magnesium transporter
VLVLTDLDVDKIAEQRRRDEFFWLDLVDPPDADLAKLGELLSLHPIALEDTREFGQRPKVDVYADHLLVVFYTARDRDGHAEPLEIHIFLSGSFVITVRRDRCDALDGLHASLDKTPTNDEGFLVYKILDALTDAYYPVIEAQERRIDDLEGQVLLHARREHLAVVYRLRQEVRELLRIASAQRDHYITTADAIRKLPGLRHGTVEYLRDVGDHLAQIAGELHRQVDDLNALTATYFNANADRLNAVATRLTILGTIFVTWTVFTGFFGQNFGWLVSHIETKTDFFGLGIGLPIGATTVACLVLWVKRHDWF